MMKSGEINPATISQMMYQIKEIIESYPAEILQRVIEEFNSLIRNFIGEDYLKNK